MRRLDTLGILLAAAVAVAILLNWDGWVAMVRAHEKSIVERSLVLFVLCPLVALAAVWWRERHRA